MGDRMLAVHQKILPEPTVHQRQRPEKALILLFFRQQNPTPAYSTIKQLFFRNHVRPFERSYDVTQSGITRIPQDINKHIPISSVPKKNCKFSELSRTSKCKYIDRLILPERTTAAQRRKVWCKPCLQKYAGLSSMEVESTFTTKEETHCALLKLLETYFSWIYACNQSPDSFSLFFLRVTSTARTCKYGNSRKA
jgi:hypothetical protein